MAARAQPASLFSAGGAGLGSDVHQLALDVDHNVPRLGVGRHLALRRAQHEAQRRDLLHHAVVELARDPGSLLLLGLHQLLVERADLRRVPLDRAHAQAVSGPEQRHERRGRERAESDRLVVRRRDREIERRALLVPHPAVVAGDHAEPVAARRKIRVLRLAHADHLSPVVILAFQLVPEANLLGRDQAESGVLDVQIASPRRQAHARDGRPRQVVAMTPAVRDDLLDEDGRREVVDRQMPGIDDLDAFS